MPLERGAVYLDQSRRQVLIESDAMWLFSIQEYVYLGRFVNGTTNYRYAYGNASGTCYGRVLRPNGPLTEVDTRYGVRGPRQGANHSRSLMRHEPGQAAPPVQRQETANNPQPARWTPTPPPEAEDLSPIGLDINRINHCCAMSLIGNFPYAHSNRCEPTKERFLHQLGLLEKASMTNIKMAVLNGLQVKKFHDWMLEAGWTAVTRPLTPQDIIIYIKHLGSAPYGYPKPALPVLPEVKVENG